MDRLIEKKSEKLGWIGTGRMGFAMADRLVSAGIPLELWNRTASKAMPLTSKGARVVDQLADLSSCDIVFMIVASSHDVAEVLFGKQGLLKGEQKPSIVVDITSIGLEESFEIRNRLSKLGIEFIAAPVSGNARVIQAGKLSVVASGPVNRH